MSIAIVGWGSLIWWPGSLRIKTRWRLEGPRLPIEFARISRDERLTLVIHPGFEDQPTYWALSEFSTLDNARRNLSERENAKLADIHYLISNGQAAEGIPLEVVEKVKGWLGVHEDLHAVIWTGLGGNWKKKRGQDFTLEDAVRYLKELEAARDQVATTHDRAREYVRNTPPNIQTAVRTRMREQGWEDAALPSILFEN
ncbi:MAG: hypothetical protein ACE5JD_10110 [Candidatus Methylomirabilia bacterium]